MALSTRVSYAGTFTPAANSVLLAIVYAVRNGTATPWTPSGITVTGGSLSWTRVAIASGPGVAGDFADSAQAWVAEVGGSPVSMTVTATPTSGDAAYALLNGLVYGWTGYNTADPVGAILQATSGPTDGLWSPTLDAAPATTSEVISVFGGITGGAGNVNPEVGSGWTAVDRLSTTDLYCLETQSRRNSTSDVCAWSDTSGPSATTFLYYGPTSIAVEIKGDGLAGIDGASSSSAKQGGRLELTGSAFGSPQGKELRLNGVSQSVLSWADTRIVVAVDRALAKYGGTINAEVWDAGVLASNSFALSGGFSPPDGWAYVDIGTPETTAANRLTASPDLATGNQVAYNARGVPSVATAPARVVVDDTGKFYCEPITSFDFEVWTSGDGWGAPATQLIDALSSVYLYEVPEDVDADDVRLRDPTTFDATGVASLTIADASHAHTADALALTAGAILSVADATHAHAADAPALTAAVPLVVADATHGHAADSISLTAGAQLAPADATHAQAADALALTATVGLSIADAAHGHAAESPALAAGLALVVADAAHAHAADAVALTAAAALAVADALHAQAADPANLSALAALSVADATHGHSAEQPELTSAQILAVNDATHGHAADSLALQAGLALTVADAAHGHAADALALAAVASLQVQDALHGHAADALSLTAGGVLAPADALHGQAADALALGAAVPLSVADALHAHAAESPAVDGTGSPDLTVADASHAHAADSLALGMAAALAVAECTHGHAAESPSPAGGAALTVADAVHGHSADAAPLLMAAQLAVSDASHQHEAEAMALTGSAALSVFGAMHLQRVDQIIFASEGIGAPRYRVKAERGRYVAQAEQARVARATPTKRRAAP